MQFQFRFNVAGFSPSTVGCTLDVFPGQANDRSHPFRTGVPLDGMQGRTVTPAQSPSLLSTGPVQPVPLTPFAITGSWFVLVQFPSRRFAASSSPATAAVLVGPAQCEGIPIAVNRPFVRTVFGRYTLLP